MKFASRIAGKFIFASKTEDFPHIVLQIDTGIRRIGHYMKSNAPISSSGKRHCAGSRAALAGTECVGVLAALPGLRDRRQAAVGNKRGRALPGGGQRSSIEPAAASGTGHCPAENSGSPIYASRIRRQNQLKLVRACSACTTINLRRSPQIRRNQPLQCMAADFVCCPAAASGTGHYPVYRTQD